MSQPIKIDKIPWLVWIYPTNILEVFNTAPRLEVTKEMRNLGWKVDLIACGPDGKHTIDGVEVLCFTRPNIYFIRHLVFHFRIISFILRNWNNIDVILFTQISALWLFPLLLPVLFRKNRPLFVMDTRTVPMEASDKSTFKEKLHSRVYYIMNALANLLADGQTAITQRMADAVHIPPQKLWGIWASGVNPEQFSPTSSERHWPEADEPVQIIYIGYLSHARNLVTFGRSVMEANLRGMNFSFLIYGDGPGRQELELLTSESKGTIKMFEAVPRSQVSEILIGAHLGVLPFPDEEKFRVSSPIKLFEYMASGLCILATKITCHTDVIGNGEYVFWAETSGLYGMIKALEEAWLQRFNLQPLSQKAKHAAQDWTYAASAKHLDHALRYGLSLHPAGMRRVNQRPRIS